MHRGAGIDEGARDRLGSLQDGAREGHTSTIVGDIDASALLDQLMHHLLLAQLGSKRQLSPSAVDQTVGSDVGVLTPGLQTVAGLVAQHGMPRTPRPRRHQRNQGCSEQPAG